MSEYIGIVVAFVLAGAFAGAFIVLASMLGPKKPSAVKSEPFECGQDPFSLPVGRLSIKFYLTAILFICSTSSSSSCTRGPSSSAGSASLGLVEMVIFLGILMVGFFYAWDNGALEWQ